MSNELKIFKNIYDCDIEKYELESPSLYSGVLYILEWGTDSVKIGCTTHPMKRLMQLSNTARYGGVDLGRVAISAYHTNYYQNEYELHLLFHNNRVSGTELFQISFDKILDMLPDLEYKDESSQIAESINAMNKSLIDLESGRYNKEFGEDDCALDNALASMLDDPSMWLNRI